MLEDTDIFDDYYIAATNTTTTRHNQSKMVQFEGKYKLDKSENFENFLKELGKIHAI